jgi:TonB-linked SusC/RagA family outer membrane protein
MTKVQLFFTRTKANEIIRLKKTIILLVFLLVSGFLSPVFAQQTQIEGRILDSETNKPLIGVSVRLVNSNTAAVTDPSGNFILTVKIFPATLTISYLGYKNLDVEIYEYNEPVTFFLNEELGLLNEVVVVGYGTQKWKELTGSISSVPKIQLGQVASSFDNLLGGAIPGVNVIQTSGQPGATSTIRIRGGNSITGGNEPLYVIDGFISYNDNSNSSTGSSNVTQSRPKIDAGFNLLSTINPSDIESIEILKDASATAIYGTRGANGVIIITTKKGVRGSGKIQYRSSYGWQTIARKVDWMNGPEWTSLYRELTNEDWWNKYDNPSQIDQNRSYDWQSAALRTGVTQDHQLSVSGGDEKGRYAVSGNYFNQAGILLNTDFKRYTFRANLDRDVFKNFRFGFNIIGTHAEQNGISGSSRNDPNVWSSILRTSPAVPIYNADGAFNYINPFSEQSKNTEGLTSNPIADLLNNVNETKVNRALGNFFAEYEIIQGLKAKLNAGADLINTRQNLYASRLSSYGIETGGYASVGAKEVNSWQSEFTLNYDKRWKEGHVLGGLLGYTVQHSDEKSALAIVTKFLDDKTTFNSLQSASGASLPYSDAAASIIESSIGRVNYSYANRYNLTATLRADGSSRFAAGHKWGYFPSIGFAWNVNNESFLRNRAATLSNLKLRLSAGTTGNQEFGNYQYVKRLAPENYSFNSSSIVTAYVPVNIANPDLKWEKTFQYNIGLDGGFWNNRMNVSIDAYYKKTTDLLLDLPVETTTGYSSILMNTGSVSNKGLEIWINSNIIKTKKINWTASLNWSKNVNEVLDLGNRDNFPIDYPVSGALSYAAPLIVKVGHPLGTFHGYVFDGVVQDREDASNAPVTTWLGANYVMQPGDAKYVDKDGDNQITPADRDIIGNSQPDFIYGIFNNFSYDRFDLSFSLQGSYGNELYNALRNRAELTTTLNTVKDLVYRWTPANPSTTIPRATSQSNFNFDSRFVEDASYLRIKSLTVGYTIPFRLRTGTEEKIRLFFTAQNLFTWTKYSGYDPELSRSGGNEQSNLLQGIDYGAYPTARSFSIGVEITL